MPPYIKEQGGGRPRLVRPGCGVLLGLQVLVGVHQEGRKGEGSGGEGRWPHRLRPKGEILLLLGVGSPFPSPTRRGRKEEEGRRKEGAAPKP